MLGGGSTWLLLTTGAATGLVGSLLGLGGGVFLVPLLALTFGLPIRSAVAASLLAVIATASASATVSLNRGLVNLRLGLTLEMATSLGGLMGGVTSSLLTKGQLFSMFAAVMLVMGVAMAARSGRRNVMAHSEADPGALGGTLVEGDTVYGYRFRRPVVALSASFAAGAISGLLGLGGGIVKVPVLSTFCGIPIRVAAATSTLMIGVTAAASAFIYFGRGDVNLPLTAAVILGTLPGSLLGARLADRVHARSLKVIMAFVLVVVAVRMWLETP